MNAKFGYHYSTLILIAGLAAGPALRAQTAVNPSDQQVVQMDEFQVSSTSTNGYVASESTSGTRMAANIRDLPFVVNVVTKDFLHDFDYFNLAGTLDVSSLSGLDTEGNYYMRGFPGTFTLWNGFYDLGLTDPANIERVEILKGPMAGIYGQTSPAGIVNFISRRASLDPYQDLTLTAGSYGTWRVEGHADVAGQIGGVQVANLVSFAGMDTTGLDLNDVTPWAYDHQRADQEAMLFKLNDHSDIILEVNWYKKLENTGDNEMLFDYSSALKAFTGQPAPIALARFSQGGPNERQNREMTNFHAEWENRFNDVWSLRVRGYGYDRHNSEIYNGVVPEFDPSLQEVVGISTKPTRTILNEDGGAGQADLLGDYFLDNHLIENKDLFTLDYSQNWRYRLGTTLPTTLTALLPSVQNPAAPVYNTVPDYPAWTVVNRNDKVRWDTIGWFLSDQFTINDRLFLYASLRHDQVTYNLNFGSQYSNKAPFAVATPGQVQHFVNSAYSPAAGYNYKLTSNGALSLFTNYSQSFQASAQSAKLGDQPLPNTRGWGYDYGVKANFLGGRLQFTADGYYIIETGLKITVVEPDGSTESVAGGSQGSKGQELDASYQVTDNFMVRAGGGLVDARLFNEGTDTTANGLRPPTVPIDNGYVDGTYSFRGFLQGLGAVARLEYVGVSYPYTTSTTTNEWSLKYPAYWDISGGINYSWVQRLRNTKLTHTIKLFVSNATNADYVSSTGLPAPSRSYYISYEIQH